MNNTYTRAWVRESTYTTCASFNSFTRTALIDRTPPGPQSRPAAAAFLARRCAAALSQSPVSASDSVLATHARGGQNYLRERYVKRHAFWPRPGFLKKQKGFRKIAFSESMPCCKETEDTVLNTSLHSLHYHLNQPCLTAPPARSSGSTAAYSGRREARGVSW